MKALFRIAIEQDFKMQDAVKAFTTKKSRQKTQSASFLDTKLFVPGKADTEKKKMESW